MIRPLSYLNVADNSGAKKLMCIRVLGSTSGSIGDVIIAVVKDALPNMPTKKSDIVRAVVVRTSKGIKDEYIVGDILICRVRFQLYKHIFNKNFKYKVTKVTDTYITLDDEYGIPNATIRKNFIYPYCRTAHSLQGKSI